MLATTRNAATALVFAFALAGCRDEAGPAAAADRYTARGEVVRVSAAGPTPEISIRHEPIPDFKDRTGAVVGMMAMVMPFPVAEGVSLDGLSPGDKVRFRFAMDWKAGRTQVEFLEKLPPGTALDFGGGAR